MIAHHATGGFEVIARLRDAWVHVELRGEFDMAAAPAYRACIESLFANPHFDRAVVVDLAELTYCDSSGVSAFVQSKQRCAAAQRDFSLTNPRQMVRRVFEVTGLVGLVMPTDGQSPAT